MTAISGFFAWLFGTKVGVLCLLGGGIVIFFFIAWALERRTRQEYYNHEKSENDWTLFDDESGWSEFEDDNK
jgi:hypothetical protein